MASATFWKVLSSVLGVALLAGVAAAAAYFFWIKDDDGNGGSSSAASAANVQVSGVGFSNEIDAAGLPVNPRLALPSGIRAVRASVLLINVTPGMDVEGRWFQLGPADAGAEGIQISTSHTVLTADTINQSGASRVSFSLGTDGPALPDDAWLLRVYVNGKLIKTSAFVVGAGAASTNTAPPATAPTPAR